MFAVGDHTASLALGRYVRLVEKVEKQDKVAKVHDERPGDVLIADITVLASSLLHVRHRVDVNAKDHLRDLAARDGYVDPFGDLKAQCSKCIISIHGGVDCIVH